MRGRGDLQWTKENAHRKKHNTEMVRKMKRKESEKRTKPARIEMNVKTFVFVWLQIFELK